MIAYFKDFVLILFYTIRDVLPILAVIIFFQLVVLKQPIPHLKKMLVGGLYVVLGLALFLVGLEKALFPVGKIMAIQLSDPSFIGITTAELANWQSYYWIYIFDTLTKSIEVKDLKEYLSNNDIRVLSSNGGIFKNKSNVFLSGFQKMKYEIEDFNPMSYIIAFSRETFEIEWKHPTELIIETARCIGSKLYQRKSDDTLLIFEEK